MESSLRELAMYRMERAFEMLIAAEDNLKIGQYKTSLNRSYYAIFHVMRAANIIKGFDSSKHSGVIAFFKCSMGSIFVLYKDAYADAIGVAGNAVLGVITGVISFEDYLKTENHNLLANPQISRH